MKALITEMQIKNTGNPIITHQNEKKVLMGTLNSYMLLMRV